MQTMGIRGRFVPGMIMNLVTKKGSLFMLILLFLANITFLEIVYFKSGSPSGCITAFQEQKSLQPTVVPCPNDLSGDISSEFHKMTRSSQLMPPQSSFTLQGVNAQRRVEATVEEMRLFLSTHQTNNSRKIDNLIRAMDEYSRAMREGFEHLRRESGFNKWSHQKSKELGDLVKRRLDFIQNPTNCSTAKKVVCRISKDGFGSGLQFVSCCLMYAYMTQRTLVLDMSKWRYTKKGWTTFFEPLSKTCTTFNNDSVVQWTKETKNSNKSQVIELLKNSVLKSGFAFLKNGVPADLANVIATFHGNPFAWWHGQIMKYIFKPNEELMAHIQKSAKRMGFQNHIVGVHVRRTDKVQVEGQFHTFGKYMEQVEDYFKQMNRTQTQNLTVKRIFLMTDDSSIYQEAKRYPDYTFISDEMNVNTSGSYKTRYTEAGLRLIIRDMYLLSQCDFIVCTFSSNVCKTGYVMMQPDRGDASTSARSLDKMHLFYQKINLELIALKSYHGEMQANGHQFTMHAGDKISLFENFWNGTSKGRNLRTNIVGHFPSHMSAPVVNAVPMPTYPQVH